LEPKNHHIHCRAATRRATAIRLKVVGVIQDVPRGKQAEEALQQAAEEIRDLYNHAPMRFTIRSIRMVVFVQVNETELEWLGYRREEVIGKMQFQNLVTAASPEDL